MQIEFAKYDRERFSKQWFIEDIFTLYKFFITPNGFINN